MRPSSAELHQMASVGRLLAGVVHEINSPIGSVFSNNEVMSRSLEIMDKLLADGRPESIEQARKIVRTCQGLAGIDRIACERLRSVIRGLKKLSRVDGEPRTVDLNEHLRDTLKLTQAEFKKRIEVETDLAELPEVCCYPQMLNQVFLNLLVNAGQAIEGEGKIRVSTCLEGGAVHIAISDTGCGMTRQQRERAFEAGFTTKPEGEGSGLGLAIARQIVEEKHGGTIDFESKPGVGTTFHIRVPLEQARSAGQ